MKLLRELYESTKTEKHKGMIPVSDSTTKAVWHNMYVAQKKKKAKSKKSKSE
jgi:hypothetical protein